jgi:hypothetical protein
MDPPLGRRPKQRWGALSILHQQGGQNSDGKRFPSSTNRAASTTMENASHFKIEASGGIRMLPTGVTGLPSESALHMRCGDPVVANWDLLQMPYTGRHAS